MKSLFLFLMVLIVAAGWTSETHAFQAEYNFNQRIISLECMESEVDSGGAINRDLYPEHCWRSPGAPILPDEPIPKEDVVSKAHAETMESGQLAKTGSPIYYLLAVSLLAIGAVILFTQRRVRLLIFYHKHDNIEVLDHKNKK